MAWTELNRLVPVPARGSINSGLSPLSARILSRRLGYPRESLDSSCKPVTNPALRSQIVTRDVGPFSVTGWGPAVESLRRILARIQALDPRLYRSLSSAGMLCCRLVRGSRQTASNHSWGVAIDLKIDGELDRPGDGFVQSGLLRAYRFFHEEGWYWGAGFRREDAMHFELAEATFLRLAARQGQEA